MSAPEFSYVRLPGGKATVTCTCGWTDPLGPMSVSPFDPAEALAAAGAEHPRCVARSIPDRAGIAMTVDRPFHMDQFMPDPKNITEQTTLAELATQRALLGVSSLTLMADINGQRTAIVQHPTGGLHIGQGATEAVAIETAFSSLRRALLPESIKAIAEGRTWPSLIEAKPEYNEADDYDRATGDLGRSLPETVKKP